MKPRFLTAAVLLTSWALFVAAMIWPAAALLGRSIAGGQPPDDGFGFSPRQFELLWRSTWMSAVATAVCLIVSLPGAYVVGRVRRLSYQPVVAAMLMMLLLSPPMVYAFGWERILPAGFNTHVRCIGTWALWAWPIPAMFIGAGWSRVARSAHEAAVLTTSSPAAFVHVALPVLRRYVSLGALVVFVLFFNDYGVPHACVVLVYSTELLGVAAGSTHSIDTAWASLPSVGVTTLALLTTFIVWRRCADDEDVGAAGSMERVTSSAPAAVAVGCFAVSWLIPMATLAVELASPALFAEALRTYAGDLAWSLGLALLASLAVIGMGLGVIATRGLRGYALVWAILFGALPGALIGESMVSAYNHAPTWWVYDHWPIVGLSHVARFAWIGLVTAALVAEHPARVLLDQARTDGATGIAILGRIQIPANWPALLCGAGVATAMSLADVATSSLVRVPSFSPIALVLIEKFHRFEDGMLISLSLCLVGATLPAAAFLTLALRRHRAP